MLRALLVAVRENGVPAAGVHAAGKCVMSVGRGLVRKECVLAQVRTRGGDSQVFARHWVSKSSPSSLLPAPMRHAGTLPQYVLRERTDERMNKWTSFTRHLDLCFLNETS